MMGPAMTPGLTPPSLSPSIGTQCCFGHSLHVLWAVSVRSAWGLPRLHLPNHDLASLLLAAVTFTLRRTVAYHTVVSEVGTVVLSPEQLFERHCRRLMGVVKSNHGERMGRGEGC